ncbi:MAG TPA: 4-hydroxy-tetrahydrodipicolinate reductase [Clostridiales bacterium]|nr:4-hydroxy-tetrahydrodipicolinate reductase [Clostridiales bacterium]
MTRVIICGCNGQMGQVITNIANDSDDIEVVAGIDINKNINNKYPVFEHFDLCDVKADVIIDFSHPINLLPMLKYAKANNVGIVLCTTGFSEEELSIINDSSKEIAILRSANMSLGINLIYKLIQEATKALIDADFDIEIIEKHHNKKVDAPSGTALALADAINEVLEPRYEYQYDRSTKRVPREKREIGISAVRGGTIVGEHEILFAGTDEVIEIKHTAYSKAIFAQGAIQAAKYLKGKPLGMYKMGDVINSKN